MSNRPYDADVLASRLDRALPPGTTRIPAWSNDPLVNAAALVARTRPPEMQLASMQRIEARVLAAFDMPAPAPVPTLVPLPPAAPVRARPRRATAWVGRLSAVASVVLVMLIVGLTPVAASSVPGDVLYPVKQGVERVELALAMSPDAQASVYLAHAERRAEEALVLVRRGQFNPDLLLTSVTNMADAADAARSGSGVSPEAQERALNVTVRLRTVLANAGTQGLASPETINPIATDIRATENSGALPLAATQTPTPTNVPTLTPTTVPTTAPTSTVMPTSEPTETPRPTHVPPAAANQQGGNGSANGNANGAANGSTNGSANGNANGAANGSSDGSANGNANGAANGSTNGNANGSSTDSGSDNGNASGNANGNSNDGSDNGNASGNANGNSNDGSDNGNASGNANGNSNDGDDDDSGNANGNSGDDDDDNGNQNGNRNGNRNG